MLTSGMTAARHTATGHDAAIREVEGLRRTDPGYAAVPFDGPPEAHRDTRVSRGVRSVQSETGLVAAVRFSAPRVAKAGTSALPFGSRSSWRLAAPSSWPSSRSTSMPSACISSTA